MYLVQIIHVMDDIAIRLFDDKDKALSFAKRISETRRSFIYWDRKVQRITRIYASTPLGVRVVPFSNKGIASRGRWFNLEWKAQR
ncbi:MAG: hypothetical protein L0Y56_05865 [Nitrospira sp.]|nr:hypothetical protein [Nitrospira sp.]